MKRGMFFAVLTMLAATFASPATAAPPSGVVYEVVRRASAAVSAEVEVHSVDDGPVTILRALIEPRAGGRYRMWSAGGSWRSGGGAWTSYAAVELTAGRRYVVGGPRGRIRVVVKQAGWSVREIGSGFRTVATPAKVDRDVAGIPVEKHGRATAAGGAYGSLAWARVPCSNGFGSWSVGTEAEAPREQECAPFNADDSALVTTVRGRRWTVQGEHRGLGSDDYSLAVLDFPKPVSR